MFKLTEENWKKEETSRKQNRKWSQRRVGKIKIEYRYTSMLNSVGRGGERKKSVTSLCSWALIKYNKYNTPELKHTPKLIPEALSNLVN